jgi:lipopolysaccharide heptosyltransferase II
MKINKILVIRISSMGDVLLTTPLLRQLKNKYPNADIDFIVAKEFFEIIQYNPYVNKVFQYVKSMKLYDLIIERLHNLEKKYDLIIDLQANFRSMHIITGFISKVVKVKKYRLKKLFLVHCKKNYYDKIIPIPEIIRQTVDSLGVKDDGKGLELWLPEEVGLSQYPPENKQYSLNENLNIALAPGAYHKTKQWLPERFAELIDYLKVKFNANIFILGGESDKIIASDIIKKINSIVSDCTGSKSIFNTAKIIDSCDLLITNDTGVMHIAAARRIPIVSIFGSSVKEFGFEPFRVNNEIVETELPCRPCSHIGREDCPEHHFNCMKNIHVIQVVDAIRRVLNLTYYQVSN